MHRNAIFWEGTENHNRITCMLFHKILQYIVVLNISGHQSGKSNFKQMQRMSQHNNAPLKLRNLHHLSLTVGGSEIVRMEIAAPKMLSSSLFEEGLLGGYLRSASQPL